MEAAKNFKKGAGGYANRPAYGQTIPTPPHIFFLRPSQTWIFSKNLNVSSPHKRQNLDYPSPYSAQKKINALRDVFGSFPIRKIEFWKFGF
jgi:hypothetical protein